MKIENLGTGCYNCIKRDALIHEVLREPGKSGIEGELPPRETLIEWFLSIPVSGKTDG